MSSKRVFVIADHGLSVVYFLQSDVISTLLESGVEVVLLTDDELTRRLSERFGRPGLLVEGLRLNGGWVVPTGLIPRQWTPTSGR